MSIETTLDTLSAGQSGRITGIGGAVDIRRRLMEMGLTPGTRIKVVRFAPMGDPMDLEVRGYHLSLRKQEASCVTLATTAST
jgi:ferrous iron transport protein A